MASGGLSKQFTPGEKPLPLFAVAFSPNGQFAATSGAERVIRVWDVNSGAAAQTLAGFSDPIYKLSFNAAGTRILSCGQAGVLNVWNIADGKPAFTATAPSVLYSSAFTITGDAVAVAGANGQTAFVAVPASAQ